MPSPLRLYRVFPWLEDAPPGSPGHPLYVAHPQGQGRIDNPDHYLTLYASDHREGAIAEAFGNHAIWTPDLLQGPASLPGSRRALATLDASDAQFVDLDDPHSLTERDLRPSVVVTRDRGTTQQWALNIFNEGKWHGIRWWSFHNPDWGSFGVWNIDGINLEDVAVLNDDIPLVREVAHRMCRVWED